MAVLVDNSKGFKVVKMTANEVLNTFDGSLCICDYCNAAATTKTGMGGYYISVLNSLYCEKCYNEWESRAENHPEDRKIEERNYLNTRKKLNVIEIPFFWSDDFTDDIDDKFIQEVLDFAGVDAVEDLPEDFKIQCNGADLEPIVKFTPDWIAERVNEDRFSEQNSDDEFAKIYKLLKENINFDAINKEIPRLYYSNPIRTFFLTKKDLKDV